LICLHFTLCQHVKEAFQWPLVFKHGDKGPEELDLWHDADLDFKDFMQIV